MSHNALKFTCIGQCVIHEFYSRQVLQIILCLLVKVHNITLDLPPALHDIEMLSVIVASMMKAGKECQGKDSTSMN